MIPCHSATTGCLVTTLCSGFDAASSWLVP
ncbi:hypothetical protein J2T61_000493 [Methanocalculus sp. AMF5]|nr:hypothetical protein [Methanocalculus sp. AMF5]